VHLFRKVGDKVIQFSKSIGEAVCKLYTAQFVILEYMSKA
jgi:hypothetical protein